MTVVYKRLGWIWDYPVSIKECRKLSSAKFQHETNEQRRRWDNESCRFLHITSDMQEVSYDLSKPGKFWRITGSYEPYVSVSSAIKVLQWQIRESPSGTSRVEASGPQKIEMSEDIKMLQKHLRD